MTNRSQKNFFQTVRIVYELVLGVYTIYFPGIAGKIQLVSSDLGTFDEASKQASDVLGKNHSSETGIFP